MTASQKNNAVTLKTFSKKILLETTRISIVCLDQKLEEIFIPFIEKFSNDPVEFYNLRGTGLQKISAFAVMKKGRRWVSYEAPNDVDDSKHSIESWLLRVIGVGGEPISWMECEEFPFIENIPPFE